MTVQQLYAPYNMCSSPIPPISYNAQLSRIECNAKSINVLDAIAELQTSHANAYTPNAIKMQSHPSTTSTPTINQLINSTGGLDVCAKIGFPCSIGEISYSSVVSSTKIAGR